MTALCISSVRDRLCVAWTAATHTESGTTEDSGRFTFRSVQYRLQLLTRESGSSLRLVQVAGQVADKLPFVTVLVEKPDSVVPKCRLLACERISELHWECPVDREISGTYASSSIFRGDYWDHIRFVVIFEDLTSAQNDNIEQPTQTECDQGTSRVWDFPPNLDNLSLDLANLLKNETLPDVKLKCRGREHAIPAHRSVLAARSEVFAAMFRNEMAESRSGDVDVPDVQDDVIDPFLQYVYSGKIPSGVSDEVVPGLYAAADKYAVHALRETCRDRMVSCLTEENCVELLTLADAHGDADFKKSVIEFVCSHKAVFKGDAWREFAKKPSLLAMEVYQSQVERET